MKKVIITIVITAILGGPNSALAWSWGWSPAPNLFASKPDSKPTSTAKKYTFEDILKLLELQLDTNKQQLEQTKKTHQSITENRQFGSAQTSYTSFFLKNPESIYNKDNTSDIFALVKNILQRENTSTSVRESRDAITKRIQYATGADKVVSLKTFQDAENRFKKILELVEQINKTTDLKSIADLQAHIAGMLAMIQNETAKLQMVSYSHNAEQALIKQKKYNRNMKILDSKNTQMPNIKSTR